MEILIVEDDSFKFSEIESLVRKDFKGVDITTFDNVYDTVNYLKDYTPDKIILDMSLPSHSAKAGEGSPLSMPSGGIEVIFELRILKKLDVPIIILTQYPEIEIEDEYYTISESESAIKEYYGVKELFVEHYENDSGEWKNNTEKFLRGVL